MQVLDGVSQPFGVHQSLVLSNKKTVLAHLAVESRSGQTFI
ncbi:hypothetical protein NSP_24910 [Nodularia spumigena CCY9414]|nr:hypothetical protein NSP_24910 [Nodularia spumigena CCY9414]